MLLSCKKLMELLLTSLAIECVALLSEMDVKLLFAYEVSSATITVVLGLLGEGCG